MQESNTHVLKVLEHGECANHYKSNGAWRKCDPYTPIENNNPNSKSSKITANIMYDQRNENTL